MQISRRNNTRRKSNGLQICRPKKKCNIMLNDKRIKACISRYDNRLNGAYSRMQFLTAVSHSTGVHAEALCLTAASSSSSDEDETYDSMSPATTSESTESPATTASLLMFALKGKYKIFWQANRCSFFTTLDDNNALLYEPLVNFTVKIYCLCLAAAEIVAFC